MYGVSLVIIESGALRLHITYYVAPNGRSRVSYCRKIFKLKPLLLQPTIVPLSASLIIIL